MLKLQALIYFLIVIGLTSALGALPQQTLESVNPTQLQARVHPYKYHFQPYNGKFLHVMQYAPSDEWPHKVIIFRLWLVKSSVIVPFCVINSTYNAVTIINYFWNKKILFSKKEKRQ